MTYTDHHGITHENYEAAMHYYSTPRGRICPNTAGFTCYNSLCKNECARDPQLNPPKISVALATLSRRVWLLPDFDYRWPMYIQERWLHIWNRLMKETLRLR
jgi:hypothetical protein